MYGSLPGHREGREDRGFHELQVIVEITKLDGYPTITMLKIIHYYIEICTVHKKVQQCCWGTEVMSAWVG